ncbi:hypothetical protein BGZ73_002636 [Actinomortierella ambigua]|nr:hypothetical protein BGZ73_002636 [Actinomortierella ambigua]
MVTIANLIDIPELPSWTASLLERSDLYRCVLVSRSWYNAFLPLLWSSFGNRAAVDPMHYQLEMYTKGTQDATHPRAPSMWDRFFYGLHLAHGEPKFILATLVKHQRHVRDLYICSFQTLVAFCAASRTITSTPSSSSSSTTTTSTSSSSSFASLTTETTATTTTIWTNLRKIESMHINLQPVLPPKVTLDRYRLMVWELVQSSPRLESLRLSGFPLPRREWFRSLLSAKACLTQLDLTTQFQDDDFLQVAEFLPKLQQLSVCLHRKETLDQLAAMTITAGGIRYPPLSPPRPLHTHLRRLSLRLTAHAGTVDVACVIRLLQAFPALQRLWLEDAELRRVEMVLDFERDQPVVHAHEGGGVSSNSTSRGSSSWSSTNGCVSSGGTSGSRPTSQGYSVQTLPRPLPTLSFPPPVCVAPGASLSQCASSHSFVSSSSSSSSSWPSPLNLPTPTRHCRFRRQLEVPKSWADADLAQLILWVPGLNVLREYLPGPLTMQALATHCRDYFESLAFRNVRHAAVVGDLGPGYGYGHGHGYLGSYSSSNSNDSNDNTNNNSSSGSHGFRGFDWCLRTVLGNLLFSFPQLKQIQAPMNMVLSFDVFMAWVLQWHRRRLYHLDRCQHCRHHHLRHRRLRHGHPSPSPPSDPSSSSLSPLLPSDSHPLPPLSPLNDDGSSSSSRRLSCGCPSALCMHNHGSSSGEGGGSSGGCWDTLEMLHCQVENVPEVLKRALLERGAGFQDLVAKYGKTQKGDGSCFVYKSRHDSGSSSSNSSMDSRDDLGGEKEGKEKQVDDNDDEDDEDEDEDEELCISITSVYSGKAWSSIQGHPWFTPPLVAPGWFDDPFLMTELVFQYRRGHSRALHQREDEEDVPPFAFDVQLTHNRRSTSYHLFVTCKGWK